MLVIQSATDWLLFYRFPWNDKSAQLGQCNSWYLQQSTFLLLINPNSAKQDHATSRLTNAITSATQGKSSLIRKKKHSPTEMVEQIILFFVVVSRVSDIEICSGSVCSM